MKSRHMTRIDVGNNQGRNCEACRRATVDALESPVGRALTAILVLIVLGMILQGSGVDVSWPL
jgi:hypothetical protein